MWSGYRVFFLIPVEDVLARESSELGDDGSTLQLPESTLQLDGLWGFDAACGSSGASDYLPVSLFIFFLFKKYCIEYINTRKNV